MRILQKALETIPKQRNNNIKNHNYNIQYSKYIANINISKNVME